MEDYKTLAQQLIDAVTASAAQETKNIEVQKGNAFSDINNSANASGVLYSTRPGFQKSRYIANTYEPAKAAIAMKPLTTQTTIASNLLDTTRAIDAQNKAAAILNTIKFDY